MLLMSTGSLESDWDLLNRLGRDPAALEVLFRRHRDFVFRLAWSRIRDHHLAEEVTQEVFYRIAKGRKPFFKGAKFRTWLYRVVCNQVSDQCRKSARMLPLDAEPVATTAAPETSTDLQQIIAALPDLPDRQREVFLLRMLEGFSTRETAKALKISPGSVKTHLHRATVRLRAEFSQANPNHEEIKS